MEGTTTSEEEKKQGDQQAPKFNPVHEIAVELEKLNIDWKAPGFDKSVAEAKFLELSTGSANT
jgi:hypothetical protein